MISANAATWIQLFSYLLFYFLSSFPIFLYFCLFADDDSRNVGDEFHLSAPTTYSRMRNYTHFFFLLSFFFYFIVSFVCLLLPSFFFAWTCRFDQPFFKAHAIYFDFRGYIAQLSFISSSVWWKFCHLNCPGRSETKIHTNFRHFSCLKYETFGRPST